MEKLSHAMLVLGLNCFSLNLQFLSVCDAIREAVRDPVYMIHVCVIAVCAIPCTRSFVRPFVRLSAENPFKRKCTRPPMFLLVDGATLKLL